MKILLVYNKWRDTYKLWSYFAKKAANTPPLSLLYVAAIAEKFGHTVRVVDAEAENLPDEETLSIINEFNPDIIGMGPTTPFYSIGEKFAKKIKEQRPNQIIVLGGRHITILKEKCVSDTFNHYFLGESEISWGKYLQNGTLDSIKGFIYKKDDGEIVYNNERDIVSDLDSIPFPARHLIKPELYTCRGVRRTSILTTRNCPFKCIFCHAEGGKVRYHSPEYVLEEMKECINRYGIKYFQIMDDTFTLSRKRVVSICELIIKNNLNIMMEIGTRANLVDDEIVKLMKRAGLVKVSMGLEAVDDNVRKIARKQTNLDDYIKANEIFKKYDVDVRENFMLGLPGETMESIRKQLSFIRYEKNVNDVSISITMPYPGTELYDMAISEQHGLKILDDDWSKQTRYNGSIMQVGNLLPKEITKLHNDMMVSTYLTWWRFKNIYKVYGIIGMLLTLVRFVKSFPRLIRNKNGLFFNLPNLYFKEKT
jgi:anaerobic magnesium-protoporphyrin IX monomethyl ester cyclase